jgi:hypothetical protein
MFWFVEPTFRSHSPGVLGPVGALTLASSDHFVVYWTDFATFFCLGGIWVFMFIKQLRRSPLLPLRDGRVQESLPEEVLA